MNDRLLSSSRRQQRVRQIKQRIDGESDQVLESQIQLDRRAVVSSVMAAEYMDMTEEESYKFSGAVFRLLRFPTSGLL